MKILIDNGHGISTPGKRSPDGLFREAVFTREIARRVVDSLNSRGRYAVLLVPEEDDIPLKERCVRVNRECITHGAGNVILVSIHVNAAGRGDRWYEARGWSCYTTIGKTAADDLAECLCDAAEKFLPGHRMRYNLTDGDRDQEEGFYILKHTLCPAVLTENLFQDSRKDVEFLTSEAGKDAIVNLHVEGILDYLRFRR